VTATTAPICIDVPPVQCNDPIWIPAADPVVVAAPEASSAHLIMQITNNISALSNSAYSCSPRDRDTKKTPQSSREENLD
jgi:hypothetical protein